MKKDQKPKQSTLEKISLAATAWMGTPQSLIVHTILFAAIFFLYLFGVSFDQILLVLTTAVSLEAIYLSLFIQMTVNRTTKSLEDVQEDVEGIQEDVEDIQEDFEDIQEDVEGLEENVEEISQGFDKISDQRVIKTGMPNGQNNSSLKTIENQLSVISKELTSLRSDLDLVKNGKERSSWLGKLNPRKK